MNENTTQNTFNSLLQQYYKAWFHFHPEVAVHVGVAGYENKLTVLDSEEISALISLNQKIIFSLDEIVISELNEHQLLDYQILYNAASIEVHELLEQDWRYKKPQNYLPIEAIHQLLNRPVDDLHGAFKHRMTLIPEYLRTAKNNLSQQAKNIPMDWVNDAIQGASSGALYLRELSKNPVVKMKFKKPDRLQPLCDEAAHAVEEFEKFLRKDILPIANGDYACGEIHFNRLLNEWHDLGITSAELYVFGEKLFKQTQKELQDLCDRLPGSNDIEEQLAEIRHQHPKRDGDDLMNAYKSRMQAARQFVIDNELVSMPLEESLKVVETPLFLRHEIPFAAYDEPSYKDPEQRGSYYVTPVRSDGHLLEHNWTSIDLTCVHEAFPGHHLQFVTANQNPDNSLPRLLNASATLYEGWALYCEDMMQEQGFLDKPEHQFIVLRDRLWRALRVMLDVELHTKNLSINDAAQRMCDVLGFSIDQAKADLSWYTQSPTVPMSYAVGWALIKALRDEQSKKAGFNLKQFHDDLLSVGSCALPLVIKKKFGEASWQAAKEIVFC